MIAEKPYRTRPNILVTGTPGTGKTTFCQLLNQSLNFTYLPIGELVKNHHLYSEWNEQFDVPEFSDEMVVEFVEGTHDILAGGLLFDFHSPDVFPEEWFDLVVLLRCTNDVLYTRLQLRGYPQHKITENIECEIFQEIKMDILDYFTDTTVMVELTNEKEEQMQANLETIIKWLIAYKEKHSSQP